MPVFVPIWVNHLNTYFADELPEANKANYAELFRTSCSVRTDFALAKRIWLARVLREIAAPVVNDPNITDFLVRVLVGLETIPYRSDNLPSIDEVSVISSYAGDVDDNYNSNYDPSGVSPEALVKMQFRRMKVSNDRIVADILYTAILGDVAEVVHCAADLNGEETRDFARGCLRMALIFLESLTASAN